MNMRRKDREIPDPERIFDILSRCDTINLGMNGDAAPYVIPMTFGCELKDGKITEVHAEQGEDILRDACTVDEGASFFGEVALVPFDSPISNSGILFYNTLFDENAACHLALGDGFINCIRDYDKYTLDECRAMGINMSMIHEDFMIGSEDLEITGIDEAGREIQIFKEGSWAF